MQRSCPLTVVLISIGVAFFAPDLVLSAPLDVGEKVRVEYSGTDYEGYVVSVGRDTLAVAAAGAYEPLLIPSASITNLEASAGEHSNWGTGLLVGAGVGLLVGLVVTGPDDDTPNDFIDDDSFDTGAILGLTVIGGLLGTVFGSVIKSDEWETVEPEEYRVGIMGNDGEVRVAFTAVF